MDTSDREEHCVHAGCLVPRLRRCTSEKGRPAGQAWVYRQSLFRLLLCLSAQCWCPQ